MRPTVDELHHSGRYRLIESFKIDDMNQFLLRELGAAPKAASPSRKLGTKTLLFAAGFMLVGGVLGYLGGRWLKTHPDAIDGTSLLWQVGASFLAFWLLLPLHEFIHGLAFKRIGAPNVGYGYSLKSLMVYAYSQHFPATMREVAFVAVMPFAVITLGLVVAWVAWPTYWAFWAMLLFLHTSACIGDFVLINYWRKHRPRIIYTYDDVEGERMTYFFAEV